MVSGGGIDRPGITKFTFRSVYSGRSIDILINLIIMFKLALWRENNVSIGYIVV